MVVQPQNRAGDIPPLRSIYFYPTESCNLRCSHCWVKPDHAGDMSTCRSLNRDNISVAQMESVVGQAIGLGLVNIKLTGGEPFVCPELFDFLDCFSKFDISVTIETNATLLTRSKIERLKNYNIRMLSTSLDGSGPDVHDQIRGIRGSFDRTVQAIKDLVDQKIFPQVIFCLQQTNAHDLEKTIQLAHTLGVKSFEINPLAMVAMENDQDTCRPLPLEQLLDLGHQVEKDFPRRFPGLHVNLYIPPALKGIRALAAANLNTCAIFTICGILANGDVSLCGVGRNRRELVAGNVMQQGLSDIWQNAAIFKQIRWEIPGALAGICGSCLFKHHCLGFCRADVLSEDRPMVAPFSMCQEAYEKGLFPGTRILEK